MSPIDPRLKLIHWTGFRNIQDDPSMPYRLDVSFHARPQMRCECLLGNEEDERIVVRSLSREALNELVESESFGTNPRLKKLTITGPNGIEHEINKNI